MVPSLHRFPPPRGCNPTSGCRATARRATCFSSRVRRWLARHLCDGACAQHTRGFACVCGCGARWRLSNAWGRAAQLPVRVRVGFRGRDSGLSGSPGVHTKRSLARTRALAPARAGTGATRVTNPRGCGRSRRRWPPRPRRRLPPPSPLAPWVPFCGERRGEPRAPPLFVPWRRVWFLPSPVATRPLLAPLVAACVRVGRLGATRFPPLPPLRLPAFATSHHGAE